MILLSRLRDGITARIPHSHGARHLLAGAAFATASLLISASIFATGPHSSPEARTEKAWPVSVTTIAPARLAPMFTAYGRIESAELARLQTDLVAPVKRVLVREGDWARAGDVLIELDTAELALQLAEREADLTDQRAHRQSVTTEYALARRTSDDYRNVYEGSQKKLARHQDLITKRMIAQSLLDEVVQQASAARIDYETHLRQLADFPNRIAQAEAGVARAEALRDRARIDLEHATVRAPFDGPVLAVLVSPGSHTSLAVPLVEIANADSFEIRAQVPESHRDAMRRHVAEGRPIVAHWETHTVVLTRFAANVRAGQSGLDAFFRIDSAAVAAAQTGRVVTLDVHLPPQDDLVALPPQAIYENDRIYAVEKSEDADRLRAIGIERIGDHTTASGEFRVLVRSPELASGQRIVTTQLPKAITGLKVQPVG